MVAGGSVCFAFVFAGDGGVEAEWAGFVDVERMGAKGEDELMFEGGCV